MSASLYSGEPTGDPTGVPCDPEQWSEASRRSLAYCVGPRAYRDKAYLCWRCKAPDVFTAAEQKRTFEVRKASTSQARVLCRACHQHWAGLVRKARDCRLRWVAERRTLRRDPDFLRDRLATLEALGRYHHADGANIVMLRRLIAESWPPPTNRPGAP